MIKEIERLGWFNPISDKLDYSINEEKVVKWLDCGAQPSTTVTNLFKRVRLKYKWNLIKDGKNEDEINKLLDEWKKIELKKVKEKETRQNELKAKKKKVEIK